MLKNEPLNSPQVIILAGPNGAGKSTTASALIPSHMTFVNADNIARELSDIEDTKKDLQAGRLALAMIDRLESERKDFVIETTLASRTLAPKIRRLKVSSYQFHLIFFWLPRPELAIERVDARVRMGGHGIPESTIRRRYLAGIQNFFDLYQPIADAWRVYNNLNFREPHLIAEGNQSNILKIYDEQTWDDVQAVYKKGRRNNGGSGTTDIQ